MTRLTNPARRTLLSKLVIGLSLAPLAAAEAPAAHSADLPLLSESDPAAKNVHYSEDASRAQDAQAGAICSNCSLFGGPSNASQGACTLFPDKLVKAAGWCSAWSGL